MIASHSFPISLISPWETPSWKALTYSKYVNEDDGDLLRNVAFGGPVTEGTKNFTIVILDSTEHH